MKAATSNPFLIKFGALYLPVLPKDHGKDPYYIVELPSKNIELYQQADKNNIRKWYQRGIGRTSLAEQLGYLIESHLLNAD